MFKLGLSIECILYTVSLMNVSLLMFVCISLKQICLLQVFMAD
jgi:hypothetical protein